MNESDLRSVYLYIKSLGPSGESAPYYRPPGKEPRIISHWCDLRRLRINDLCAEDVRQKARLVGRECELWLSPRGRGPQQAHLNAIYSPV